MNTATETTPPNDPAGQPAIRVRNLWKIFGNRADRVFGTPDVELDRAELRRTTGCTVAVRDISFDVAPGEVFVVMGLSGSGKSTLVRCLTRLIEPTGGTVLLDGEDIGAADEKRLRELRRHTFAMVFQHFGLLGHRKVIDNVAYGLEIRGMGRAERHAKAREILDMVGLRGNEDSYPDQLSGGMQQRVGLARALAVDPEVLLFDEPFSALDPLIRRDMQAEVIRLQRELRKTVVFITHDLSEALKLGDRIAILRDGRLVQVGRPEEVVGAPADDYVRDFVREVPRASVLTVRQVMRPVTDDDPVDGPEVTSRTVVQDVVPMVAASEVPVRVVADGTVLGVVGRAEVLDTIAETDTTGAPVETR